MRRNELKTDEPRFERLIQTLDREQPAPDADFLRVLREASTQAFLAAHAHRQQPRRVAHARPSDRLAAARTLRRLRIVMLSSVALLLLMSVLPSSLFPQRGVRLQVALDNLGRTGALEIDVQNGAMVNQFQYLPNADSGTLVINYHSGNKWVIEQGNSAFLNTATNSIHRSPELPQDSTAILQAKLLDSVNLTDPQVQALLRTQRPRGKLLKDGNALDFYQLQVPSALKPPSLTDGETLIVDATVDPRSNSLVAINSRVTNALGEVRQAAVANVKDMATSEEFAAVTVDSAAVVAENVGLVEEVQGQAQVFDWSEPVVGGIGGPMAMTGPVDEIASEAVAFSGPQVPSESMDVQALSMASTPLDMPQPPDQPAPDRARQMQTLMAPAPALAPESDTQPAQTEDVIRASKSAADPSAAVMEEPSPTSDSPVDAPHPTADVRKGDALRSNQRFQKERSDAPPPPQGALPPANRRLKQERQQQSADDAMEPGITAAAQAGNEPGFREEATSDKKVADRPITNRMKAFAGGLGGGAVSTTNAPETEAPGGLPASKKLQGYSMRLNEKLRTDSSYGGAHMSVNNTFPLQDRLLNAPPNYGAFTRDRAYAQSVNQLANGRLLHPNVELLAGQILSTAGETETIVRARLANNAEVVVGPGSEIMLLNPTEIQLRGGEVWISVPPGDQVDVRGPELEGSGETAEQPRYGRQLQRGVSLMQITGRVVLRAERGLLREVAGQPEWLTHYQNTLSHKVGGDLKSQRTSGATSSPLAAPSYAPSQPPAKATRADEPQ